MFSPRLSLLALTALLSSAASAQNIGTAFCQATANSTGQTSVVSGSYGSGTGSGLHLEVTGGVPNEFGYFLVGNEATTGLAISNGLLCLVGTSTSNIYRYNVAGGVMNSLGRFDAAGVMQNVFGTSQTGSGFDVPNTIPASVPIVISSGDTWYFQYWHRDTPAGAGSSNFSLGLGVTFGLPYPVPGMVQIPAGTFEMGSNDLLRPVQPVHTVTISQSFWMGRTEVTHAEYNAQLGLAPPPSVIANQPAGLVTWNQARGYCASLTAQEVAAGNLPLGYEYRLPTEAEWEYACRATTTTEFYTGDHIACSEAVIYGATDANGQWQYCGHGFGAWNVRTYAPNAWGLYDMHGNREEWCLDTFAPYSPGPVTDPFVSGGQMGVVRGGDWWSDDFDARSASREAMSFAPPPAAGAGFRVVLGGVLVP